MLADGETEMLLEGLILGLTLGDKEADELSDIDALAD